MDKITLKSEKRTLTGKKVRALRRQGIVPANIFGKGLTSQSIQVNLKEFKSVFDKAGETSLIELTLGEEKEPVLVSNIQVHPVTGDPVHVDFRKVNLKEKITATVPVEVVGESPAEKSGIGTAVEMIDEVEVEALPTDLPEKFEVDVTGLTEVDQAIYVKDLKVDPTKVEIKTDGELIVVKIEPPQKEEVIEAPAPAEGEVPAEGAAAPTEEGQSSEASSEAPQKEG